MDSKEFYILLISFSYLPIENEVIILTHVTTEQNYIKTKKKIKYYCGVVN